MNERLLKSLQKRMEERRNEITSAHRRFRDENKERDQNEGAQDYVDYALSSYTKEFLYSLSNMERKDLHHIEEALARIKEGTYGECQECGEQISDKRLNAVPWARHCLSCQELEEQGLLPSLSFKAKETVKPSTDKEVLDQFSPEEEE